MNSVCPEPTYERQARNVLMENTTSSGSDPEDTGSDDDVEEVSKPAVVNPRDQEALNAKLRELSVQEAETSKTLDQLGAKTNAVKRRKEDLDKEIGKAEKELNRVEHPALLDIAMNERAKAKALKEIQDVEEDMQKTKSVWQNRRSSLKAKHSQKKAEMKKLTYELRNLTLAVNGEVPPVGPQCLSFVDGDPWTVASSMVIIANIWVMIYEMRHPYVAHNLRGLDDAFLLFYIVELVLKFLYRRQHLLIGPCWAVWANWLDVMIVLTGLLELGIEAAGAGENVKFLSWLRVLRLFRLARVGKIVLLLLTRDLSWASGARFQSFILGVIGFNCILMGFEIEFPRFEYWPVLENGLLVIYTFELLLRIRVAGCSFFYDRKELFWNYLDFFIVLGAVFDQWVRPASEMIEVFKLSGKESTHGTPGQIFNLLRLLRLVRLLRLAKLIKNIGPLYVLAVGIAKAMQGMGWVMVLAVCALYVGALLCVKLIGEGILFKPTDLLENPTDNLTDATEQWEGMISGFRSIPDAMFNLFKVMNCDTSGLDEIVFATSWLRWFVIIFTIITNWAIFSILTAVVSDNMAQVEEEHQEELAEAKSVKKKEVVTQKIGIMFNEVDQDKSHTIHGAEFKEMLSDEARAQEFEEITGIGTEDAGQLFDVTSRRNQRTGVPEITHENFIASLNKEGDDVTQRSIMKLEKRLAEIESMIES